MKKQNLRVAFLTFNVLLINSLFSQSGPITFETGEPGKTWT